MQDKHHDIDKLFQDAFQNHEAAPPFNMWNKIESNLPLTETDMMFKNAFENYEKEPSPEVWERIKPELPLSLTLRNGFVHLSRIAAVLLIAVTLYVFVQQFDWQTNHIAEVVEQQQQEQQQQQQQETIFQEQQEVVQGDAYDEVITEQEVINEPLAMLEEDEMNMLPPGPAEISEMPADSPLNNPANAAKGGKSALTKVVPNQVYAKEVIINIDEIDKRLKANNKERIPSSELFFVNSEEEESSRVDSTKKKDEAKELENMKMEDAYAVAFNVDFDGKIRRPYKEQTETTTAALPYLSLQGKADGSFQTKGIRLKRSNLEKAAFDFTGLQLNVNAAFGTSSILSNSFTEMIAGEDGQRNLLTGGNNLGLGIGYQFKPNWSVETGVNYVNQSQTYQSPFEGNMKSTLNYMAIPLTFKYRSNEITGAKPSAVSYVFGLQTAFLNEKHDAVKNSVINKEIGATVGVDYDLFLNPNVSWTIGARATVGTGIENSFENYNTFVGIRSALNFRFAK